MFRRPPRFSRSSTPFPCTTLFRSKLASGPFRVFGPFGIVLPWLARFAIDLQAQQAAEDDVAADNAGGPDLRNRRETSARNSDRRDRKRPIEATRPAG